jgi:hypothetical protein
MNKHAEAHLAELTNQFRELDAGPLRDTEYGQNVSTLKELVRLLLAKVAELQEVNDEEGETGCPG